MDDEARLISRAVGGDAAALELLLYMCRRRLFAYIRTHFPAELKGVLEPQDLLQDVWLRAIRAISDFQPEGSDPVYRWLVTITRNLISDHVKYVRRLKRAKKRAGSEEFGGKDSILLLLAELVSYRRTPSKSAASHELMAALESAIKQLPLDQAQALRLRYLQELNLKEAAQVMQRSEGSVAMLCNRGVKMLRAVLRSASFYV
jgi:RNA polymerase sigma-70 factor, ECF subfamily